MEGLQQGVVQLTYGSVDTTVPITAGKGSFSLPATLAPGSYTLGLVFNGDDELLPSEPTSIPVTVVKKATSPKVSGAAAVVKGKSLAVKVGVAGMVAGTYPTGTVTVQAKVGSGAWKTVATKTLTAGSNGVVSASVKAPAKPGVLRVRAVYGGDTYYTGATSPVKVVKVKKK